MIEIIKTHDLATFDKATEGSVGYDLSITKDITLSSETPHALAPTGICINMTKFGIYGMVTARSSLYSRTRCVLGNGVGIIDNDYLGEIKISLLYCPGRRSGYTSEITIEAGDRIAQFIFMPIMIPTPINFVEKFGITTARNDGGFGSSDICGGKIIC